jgi:methyl-accepting chemotaxis protein
VGFRLYWLLIFKKEIKMISTVVSKFFGGDQAMIKNEVAEFRALKKEINKARCVIEFNADGTISQINENALKALGYSDNELLMQHHRTLVGRAEASSQAYQTFWPSLAEGKSQTGTFQLQNKQGDSVWFQGYYAPVLNQQNELVKTVAYLTDITNDKQTAIELQGEDAALHQSFGIMECDLKGNILDCNALFVKPLGYAKEELIGKHVSILLDANTSKSDDYKTMWQSLNAGETQTIQIKRIAKDGKFFWFQSTYVPVKDENDEPFKVVVYSFCITQEKIKNADYVGQIDAINKAMGVIEFDLKGNITKVNENFATVTGYSEKELVGNHHSMLLDDKLKSSAEYKQFWEDLVDGKVHRGQFSRVGKGGKPIRLEASYNAILDPEGKPFKIVKYATDITADYLKDKKAEESAKEATLIKNTLDSASTMMMMADNDGIIRYMNPAAGQLMQDSAPKLRKILPNFDPNNLIGQNFDVFHKNPSHQRNILGSLTKPYDTTIPVEDLFFKLKASPIVTDGIRLGTALEWADVTQERNVENDIDRLISAAVNGDFSERISLDDKTGTSEKICDGINSLVDKMTEIILQVKEAGETINTAAGEISTGNNDLSSRTEQQASSLEETAASMEELASTVKQNAENALQANQLAAAASGVAIKGGQVVGNVVNTMSAINDSARKIEDIISVIDGIAFQTNILALNAAVEAARAGEQGRGFAVVAGEVRTLAQRSASAAKEIKELITDSVSKTTEGTKQVEEAGTTMEEIVSSVQRVTDIMGEISAASKEQSTGINQVNEAVTNMDEVTQQNAALVEEAAAAAESLVEQATSLMDTVSAFKLKGMQLQERRASSSPMRSAQVAPKKPVVKNEPKPMSKNIAAKTGTDDGDWEEF